MRNGHARAKMEEKTRESLAFFGASITTLFSFH